MKARDPYRRKRRVCKSVMIRVGLCDDEKPLLEKLNSFVTTYYGENRIFARVQAFEKGQNLLWEIEDGGRFDLLLLDIEMPGMGGMELAQRAKKLLPDVLIIFITSHMEYVLDAYELSVFRYVPRADPGGRLAHALLDAAAMVEVQLRDSYVIQNQNRLERIPLQNLLYIIHEGKNAVLVTNLAGERDGEGVPGGGWARQRGGAEGAGVPGSSREGAGARFKVRKTLQQVYAELDETEFFFIDRGCIVNLSRIMSIREDCCILKDGTRLPVSQSRLPGLKERLLKFWKRHI